MQIVCPGHVQLRRKKESCICDTSQFTSVSTCRYSLNIGSLEYGALKNDAWTGLIGDVLYRKSHLAISEISFTRQRTEVISYLYPVLYDVLSYATRAPTVIPFAMAIIKPFSED
ncbi:hypothetical protein MTO96_044567, partial [Rhipicephalus appendiculatus]